MPLPDWAQPPEPGFEHGDNYSLLEVVWSHPDGRVIVQTPPQPVDVPNPTISHTEMQGADGRDERRRRIFRRNARR